MIAAVRKALREGKAPRFEPDGKPAAPKPKVVPGLAPKGAAAQKSLRDLARRTGGPPKSAR